MRANRIQPLDNNTHYKLQLCGIFLPILAISILSKHDPKLHSIPFCPRILIRIMYCFSHPVGGHLAADLPHSSRRMHSISTPNRLIARDLHDKSRKYAVHLINLSLFPFSSRLCACWLRLNYCYKAMIISFCLGALMLSLFGLYFGIMNPKMKRVDRVRANDSLLIPPNPEVLQPPSPSVLHVFSNAAVCSDSDICSRIGR